MSQLKHIVTKDEHGLPLKTIVKSNFNFSSRFMTRLKQAGLIFVNEEPFPNWIGLKEGDKITINMPEETNDFPPENIPVNVIFEDEHLLIVDKQPDLVVHPTKGKPNHTLSNAISYKQKTENDQYKIRFVNRLDMNTSGLVVVAKNSYVQDCLVKEMQKNIMEKSYIAIVKGIFKERTGIIDLPIGRPDPNEVERWILPQEMGGYPSLTHYKVLEEFENINLNTSKAYLKLAEKVKDLNLNDGNSFSLVELRLETGRTHQIRVHLSYMGHPILGDSLYKNGDPFLYRKTHKDTRPSLSDYHDSIRFSDEIQDSLPASIIINRQALHAFKLGFKHPITGENKVFEAPVPDDIKKALGILRGSKKNKINAKKYPS